MKIYENMYVIFFIMKILSTLNSVKYSSREELNLLISCTHTYYFYKYNLLKLEHVCLMVSN